VDPKPAEPEVEEEEEEEDEPEEPEEPEEEDPERLPEDPEPYPDQGPPGELELTDEQMDAQGAAKQAAVEAMEDGDMAKALEKYTEAIKIGNASAMLITKRAELLLKMKRPNACIADCTAAILVNPDSGKAYRTRGKAHRRLGHWKEAHEDIAMGQKLDFDDDLMDIQKFVDEKWKKIAERETRRRLREERIAKKKKEADMKRRKAEAQKAYEEAKAAESAGGYPGGFPGGFPGMGGMGGFPGMGGMGGMPGMPAGMDPSMLSGLLSDPELMAAFSNPKMAAAMQDIMSNPANMAKYQSDPEIMGLFQKMMGKMGGAGGMPGGFPGAQGAGSSSAGPTVEEMDEPGDANEVD
jgi:suppressor of tumorigenicity protein 13